jgi:CDP-diacylglycerol--glycerol-3-phosphate 3-phosphatidyltransferase
MPSVYDLKPRFQALLRPLATWLSTRATANQVTIAACILSVVTGAALAFWAKAPAIFLLVPPVMLVRMALNALDGMLAREFGQASKLGAHLNEICDVVSDTALILPFALAGPFQPAWVVAFALAAILTEFCGVLGQATGGARNYHGPFGKSDRAVALSVVAVLVAAGWAVPPIASWLFPLMAMFSVLTAVNRTRAALAAGP